MAMVMNENFDNSQRRSFISYCKENLHEKKWKERDFKGELYTNSKYCHYYPPCGSNGHFIIQVDILDFKFKDKIFAFGFQYQDASCKLNMWRPGLYYNNSDPQEIEDLVPLFIQNRYIFQRFNPPKLRAYYSMSKKDRSFCELPDEKFSRELFFEFIQTKDIIENQMKSRFQKIGCQFM